MAKIVRQAGKVAARIVLLLAIFGLILYSVKMLTPAKAEEDSVIDPQIAELIQTAELLTNGDFEDDGGMGQHGSWDGDVPGWLGMGDVHFYQHSDDVGYRRGTYALAMWKQDWKQGSGLVQVIPASPDDIFTISGSMIYSAVTEPLTNGSLVLRLEFWDDAQPTGTLLERITAGILSADDPADTWKDVQTLGLAPAGTSEARVILTYYGLGMEKAHFDDISLADENTTGEAGGPIPADGAVRVDASTTTEVKWVNAVGTGPTEVEVLLAIEGGPNSTILTRQVISSWIGRAPLPLLDEDTDYVWTVNYYDDSSDITPKAALRSTFNTGNAPPRPQIINLLDPYVWLDMDDGDDPNLKHIDDANLQSMLDRFSTEFLDEEKAPRALYEIGTGYESAGAKDKAFAVYQAVLDNWTENKNELWVREALIEANISLGNYAVAEAEIDRFITDFKDHPEFAPSISRIEESYYNGIFLVEGLVDEDWLRPLEMWEKVLDADPNFFYNDPDPYYFIAICYYKLCEYQSALEYFEFTALNWPDKKLGRDAQWMLNEVEQELIMLAK